MKILGLLLILVSMGCTKSTPVQLVVPDDRGTFLYSDGVYTYIDEGTYMLRKDVTGVRLCVVQPDDSDMCFDENTLRKLKE